MSTFQGSASDMDGDNINVVVRVRPISNKEQRNNDEGIIQFPGEGQIWVGNGSFDPEMKFQISRLMRPKELSNPSLSMLSSSQRRLRRMFWSTAE